MAQWIRRDTGGLPLYEAPALTWLPGIMQGFTTRIGGTSQPPYNELNLSLSVGDDPAAVEANRRRLWVECDVTAKQVALAEQVHGSVVAVVTEGGAVAPGVDALITNVPDVMLMLLFADCVPVYIVDPVKKAIALVHAGWRGIVAGVTVAAVEALRKNFGCQPGSCVAAIGPCIGAESYEVGSDIAQHFRRLDSSRSSLILLPKNEFAGTFAVNLRQVAFAQLLNAGLRAEYISSSTEDTFRNQRDFYSYRRDGAATGRMAGFLALRAI